MRFDQGEKFVVEPERVYQHGIDLSDFFLGCPAVKGAAAADYFLCFDTIDQVRSVCTVSWTSV